MTKQEWATKTLTKMLQKGSWSSALMNKVQLVLRASTGYAAGTREEKPARKEPVVVYKNNSQSE